MNLTASDSKIIQTPKPSGYETHALSSILNWLVNVFAYSNLQIITLQCVRGYIMLTEL
tara:strand:- start:990 stop:1163 length:174 start_codon:yes stop_codon:yes gene_type:complete